MYLCRRGDLNGSHEPMPEHATMQGKSKSWSAILWQCQSDICFATILLMQRSPDTSFLLLQRPSRRNPQTLQCCSALGFGGSNDVIRCPRRCPWYLRSVEISESVQDIFRIWDIIIYVWKKWNFSLFEVIISARICLEQIHEYKAPSWYIQGDKKM